MGTLDTVLILGAVGITAYFLLSSGVLNQVLGGIGDIQTVSGTEDNPTDDADWTEDEAEEEGARTEKEGCCTCKAYANGKVKCKIGGSKTTTFEPDQYDGDLEAALDDCKTLCVEEGEGRAQQYKMKNANCFQSEAGATCWREEAGGPVACVRGKNQCDKAEDQWGRVYDKDSAYESDTGTYSGGPRTKEEYESRARKCGKPDTCNTIQSGQYKGYKQCNCGCGAGGVRMGPNSPCSQCKTKCVATRRMRGYSNVGYLPMEYGATTDYSNIRFSMLGRQASRAYLAMPNSYDYNYSPNNFDPFQVEQGSIRMSVS